MRQKSKFLNRFLLLLALIMLFANQLNSQPANLKNGKEFVVQQWVNDNFTKGKVPPFSFRYGGIDSKTFIAGWKYSAEKIVSDEPDILKSAYSYKDPKTGLTVKCFVTSYRDFPAVEWVLKFSNQSVSTTPVIEMAEVINYSFEYNRKGSFILHHSMGSNAQRTDFQPVDEQLQIGKKISMMPAGGRSSDNTAFPFFNMEAPGGQGTIVAIGWTGKWYADVQQVDEKSVSLKSGLGKMHLILYPGEEIRTPSICLLFWKGEDRMEGHNQFRQFILAHHFRKINGKFAEYPLSGSFDYGDPAPCNEYNCLTADYAIALVKRYQQFKITPTDYISDFIKKEGIDYYRQDFNFVPMPFWENNDKPDRIGISEIRHIEGLYAYWDSLLVRFPSLLIDNCASGGRRLDLETSSRSAPLWRTDYQYGEPNGYQCHTYGLNFYLPIHGTAVYRTENYTFRSGLGATMVMNWEVTGRNSESIPAIQKCIKEFKALRPYYYGDYYPLTGSENMTQDSVWLAYQLNRPAQGDGIILAFRRKDCLDESVKVKLLGVDSKESYLLFNEDSQINETVSGQDLKNGYTLRLNEKPGSLLIRYKKTP